MKPLLKFFSEDLLQFGLPVLIGAVVISLAFYLLRWLPSSRQRTLGTYLVVAAAVSFGFYVLHRYVDDHARAVDIAKGAIAVAGVVCIFYERERAGMRRPVAERWKKFVGVTLGVAAIIAYFNGFRFGYAKYYHRWDQYHYYMGAKYFPEMGYDGLYMCALIAQDELGQVKYTNDDTGRQATLDMKREVRHPDKKIRNLGGDNLLKPASEFLDKPEQCKNHFSPERWEAFKADVLFFRTSSDKQYWEDMQKDHGYNPPPVWTVAGRIFAELFPPGHRLFGFMWVQHLAMLDIAYLLGTFAALYWAFGWRVFSIAAIFWGCQSSAPFYWTGGAFLRQDWLFYMVLSACLLRKRYFKLAGASLVYAGLLRIFPGLVVIGWLTVAGWYIARHKRMAKTHQKVLLGGVLAAAILIPVSLKIAGPDSYQQFYKHTLQVHDQTPLTNHMGLRVLVAHKFGTGVESGRMKYTKNTTLVDPFEVWKRMRNERYAKYRAVAYAIIAVSFALFVYVCRRIKSLWVAQCLGQIWIILLSQLTCYYYSFMILSAPLTRLNRQIEIPLLGLAAVSQFAWRGLYWNDDRYTVLTAISLVFCYYLLFLFAGKGLLWLWRKQASQTKGGEPAAQGT